ncbi:AraC family transcriptional regulator [Alteromonas facilis]|uniref:AraC family transcriptional regulator n=1 Tax=Alteromonas facilis TaxID=2048004 RepID=UPI000C28E9FB|nr:AraC family transcriptional regulator [Alteromonas facilis]
MPNTLMIQVSALQGFPTLVRHFGGEPKDFLRPYNLSEDAIESSQARIPVAQFAAILNDAATSLSVLEFGLLLGSQQDFGALGELGFLLRSAGTLNNAIALSNSYMSYHNQSEIWQLERGSNTAVLNRYDLLRNKPNTNQYTELAFATCIKLLKLILGPLFSGATLQLRHSAIAPQSAYQKVLGIDVVFNTEQDRLSFPSTLLDSAFCFAHPKDAVFSQNQVLQYARQHRRSITEVVTSLIEQLLGSTQPSLEFIARQLDMHKRTLQRSLAREGTVYKTLLNNIRMEKAKWYLHQSDIDITLLAMILGYQEVANFSRAFKRHTGQSPRQYRQTP